MSANATAAADDAALPIEDRLFPIAEAVERVTGYRPSPATACRWHRRGVGGVKLKSVFLGARPRTSERFVREFLEATTADRE
jgi:hypothetical protein